ncbi:MAG: hypothetical protein MJ158_03130 [Alphaproteobacteria bacterium]|nr:hypothetical protein [Alphaproteobacteria bacterium]
MEEVKNSCVATMKECYDTQTGALNDFDDTTAQSSGAIAAVTARGMCYDKVMACAALYGDPDGCTYDDKNKTLTPSGNGTCGLQSLLTFVDTVDSVKIAEGCESALKKYAEELCAPATNDTEHKYPWGCARLAKGEWVDESNGGSISTNTLYGALQTRANTFCGNDLITSDRSNTISGKNGTTLNTSITNSKNTVDKLVGSIGDVLEGMLMDECEKLDGVWISDDSDPEIMFSVSRVTTDDEELQTNFYMKVFNGDKDGNYGKCLNNTLKSNCLAKNTDKTIVATYNETKKICEFTEDWYKEQCILIGGYYENSTCFIGKDN